MPLYNQILLWMSFLAVCSDLCTEKISNAGLIVFWIMGFCYQVVVHGIKGILIFLTGTLFPIFLLYLLFVFRMLGAGDIKLLSALGGIMGISLITKCIMVSMLLGAGVAVVILAMSGNLKERLRYFIEYFHRFYLTHQVVPYRKKGKRLEHFHFSVPIFLAVLLHTGGIY